MKKLIVAFSVVIMLLLAACAPQAGQFKGEVIKIGGMHPLTGDGAAYGIPIQRGALIALEEINAQWAAKGKKLEIVWEDSRCNPKDGATAAQKLVNVDGVKVILGGVCSGETLGAAPIAEAAKVIMISPSATSPDVTKAGDFVFRLAPSDANAGRIAAEYAVKTLGAKKVAILSETTDYAQGLRKVFKENAISLGAEVVPDETFSSDDTDLRTQLLKIKKARPDIVYLAPQTVPKAALIVKQWNENNMGNKWITAEIMADRKLIEEHGKDMEGLIGIEQYFDETRGKSKAFLNKYEQKYGEKATFPFYTAANYDAVYLIADAIEKYGLDTEKIRDYLYAVKDNDGAAGVISIDEHGDGLLSYTIKQIKNGTLVEISQAK